MKLVAILLIGTTPLLAQQAKPETKPTTPPARTAKAAAPAKAPAGKPAAVAESEATPEKKKRGLFGRIFGPDDPEVRAQRQRAREAYLKRKKGEEEPTVVKAAKPVSTPRPRRSAPPQPKPSSVTGLLEGEMPSHDTPARGGAGTTRHTAPKPPVTAPREAVDPVPPAPVSDLNRSLYLATRKKAAVDPSVVALAEKLNATAPGKAYQAAAKAYARALFAEIRKLDQTQAEWYDRLEAATLRRIDSGKPFVAE